MDPTEFLKSPSSNECLGWMLERFSSPSTLNQFIVWYFDELRNMIGGNNLSEQMKDFLSKVQKLDNWQDRLFEAVKTERPQFFK